MRFRARWLWMLLAMGVAVAAVACAGGGEEGTPAGRPAGWRQVKTDFGVTDTEIKLGHTNVLSGNLAAVYAPVTPSMDAYFKKVNQEDGGVCGRQIRLIVEDHQYNPSRALEAVTKLIVQDQVVALVGDLGTPSVTGEVDYVNQQRVPHLFVSTGASKWGDYQRWPWTTGFIPDYVSEGRILARYINDNAQRIFNKPVGQVRVAMLYQNDDFGKDGANGFKQDFRGQIATEQTYESTATDITSQLINMRAANPDFVYLYSTPAFTAQAFRYMKANNWRPPVLMSYVNPPFSVAQGVGGGNVEAGYRDIAGTILTTYILDVVADRDQPPMREHIRIMQQYGGPPIQPLSAYGQSLAELVVETLKRACERGDMTREGILRAAESIRGFRMSLLLPGIEVNLGPQDHFAIQALMPAEVQQDGSVRYLLNEAISLE